MSSQLAEIKSLVLLNLHSEGIISDLAYEVLELELQKRGIEVPERLPQKDDQIFLAIIMLMKQYETPRTNSQPFDFFVTYLH